MSDQPTAAPAGSDIAILQDGTFLNLQFLSGEGDTKQIETVEVKIRKVPLRNMDKLARAWGTPEKEMQIYTDMPADTINRLSDESFAAAFEEGRRLNRPFFKRWFGWQQETLEAVGQAPRIDALVDEVKKSLLDGKSA